MRVPGIIFASRELVASLPGIAATSHAMRDAH